MTPEEYRKTEGIDWPHVHFIEESRAPVIIAFMLFAIIGAGVGLAIGWGMWG